MSADLPTHLRSFGIEDYKTDARYWTEGGDRLGRRRGEELNELRERFIVRRTLATQVAVKTSPQTSASSGSSRP